MISRRDRQPTRDSAAPLRVVFVCGRNRWRSPTAEQLYRNDPRLDVRAAGVSSSAKRRLSAKDLAWAELVIVMEKQHGARIRDQFRSEPNLPAIESLDIPDDFEFLDPELVRLIRTGTEQILDAWIGAEAENHPDRG